MRKTRQSSAVRTQPTASKAGFRQFPERAGGVSPSTSGRQAPDKTPVTNDIATLEQSDRLCFDRDIAEVAGVNAALLVKYVECSVRGKYRQNPDRRNPMWNPRTVISEELALTEDQLRTAGRKAAKADLLRIRHNQHDDKTNQVLFYSLVNPDKFFESRFRATPYSMRRDEFVELGACAAVLLHSFRYWQEQNSTVESAVFDGRAWHHDDLQGLAKVYRGVFTARQIEDTLNHLVKIGRLLRRPYDPNNGRERKRWFAVNDPPKAASSTEGISVAEPLQTQCVFEARGIPNGSTSNPKSEHVESQLHNTNGTKTDALRAGLAPLGQPFVEPKTNTTLRERPSVAPQAAGGLFENQKTNRKTSTQNEAVNLETDSNSEAELQRTTERPSVTSQTDQSPTNRDHSASGRLPVEVANTVNPVDKCNGDKAVDLKFDTEHERQMATDREGNVRETFAQCHQEVFGCNPSHGLGQALQLLNAARALNLPVRLYCLVSMVSWHMTNPDKPFPSRYLIGGKALDRVKFWIAQCREKFAAVDEKCMGLLFDQNESQGRVDWRQPEHPYKAILRHWAAEYRRFSEADFESDQASIEATIAWLTEAAPQARSMGKFSEAHLKLRDALDLITLNFEVADDPYLTPHEFFNYYDRIKKRLSARLRELRARRSTAQLRKGEASRKDIGGNLRLAPKPSTTLPPGTRRAGAPPPPPPQPRPPSQPNDEQPTDTQDHGATVAATSLQRVVHVVETPSHDAKEGAPVVTDIGGLVLGQVAANGQAQVKQSTTRKLLEIHDDDGDMIPRLVVEGFRLEVIQDFFNRSVDLAHLYEPTYEQAKGWLAKHPNHVPRKAEPAPKKTPLWRTPSKGKAISQDRTRFDAAPEALRLEAIERAEAKYRQIERVGKDATEARADWLRLRHWQDSLTVVAKA